MPVEIQSLSLQAQEQHKKKRLQLTDYLNKAFLIVADGIQAFECLRSNTLYRLEIPSGKLLQEGGDGFFRGVFYKKGGGIDLHAKFSKALPQFGDLAANMAMQAVLLKISADIQEVGRKVDRVLIGQRNDRLAHIQSGIDLRSQALQCKGAATRDSNLRDSIGELTLGINQLLYDIGEAISDLRIPRGRLEAFFWQFKMGTSNLETETREKLQPIHQLVQALCAGTHERVLAYLDLDEEDAAHQSFRTIRERLATADVEKLLKFVRQLPYEEEEKAAAPILKLKENAEGLLNLDSANKIPVHIEFTKEDILS